MQVLRNPALWLLLVAGLAIRIFFAFHWFGSGDLFTFLLLGSRTDRLHFGVYATNVGTNQVLWPYPPGYLLWLLAATKISTGLDIRFDRVAQILPILCDVGIAACVYVYLGWRKASERDRIIGFALVMLGPVFIAISGYHGQLDAVATLPGVVGFMIWERARGPGRPLASGVLIGIGGVLKTVPMLLLVPMLTRARSLRDAVLLWASAIVVAVVCCLPFYLAEPGGFRDGLGYTGVAGRGGISLVLDPAFASNRRLDVSLALSGHPNGVADWISKTSGPITFLILVALGAFLYRYRPPPIEGAMLLWLAIFAFSPNFLLQYLVWALPYFIMAGYFRHVALLQLAAIPPLIITYIGPTHLTRFWADFYVVWMGALWVFWVIACVTFAMRIARRGAATPSGRLAAEPAA